MPRHPHLSPKEPDEEKSPGSARRSCKFVWKAYLWNKGRTRTYLLPLPLYCPWNPETCQINQCWWWNSLWQQSDFGWGALCEGQIRFVELCWCRSGPSVNLSIDGRGFWPMETLKRPFESTNSNFVEVSCADMMWQVTYPHRLLCLQSALCVKGIRHKVKVRLSTRIEQIHNDIKPYFQLLLSLCKRSVYSTQHWKPSFVSVLK